MLVQNRLPHTCTQAGLVERRLKCYHVLSGRVKHEQLTVWFLLSLPSLRSTTCRSGTANSSNFTISLSTARRDHINFSSPLFAEWTFPELELSFGTRGSSHATATKAAEGREPQSSDMSAHTHLQHNTLNTSIQLTLNGHFRQLLLLG